MKILVACALLMIGTVAQGADPAITDGTSLSEGLALFDRGEAGAKLTQLQNLESFVAFAYVQGFWAGCRDWKNYGSSTPFILPPKSNGRQFELIVEKWLRDHPEALHEDAGYLMMLAMRDAFPNPAYRKPIPQQGL